MNPLATGIHLTPDQFDQMRVDVIARSGEEACGLVVGKLNSTRSVIPITNVLHSATRFRMDPVEQLKAFMLADEKGWDILAIYHSHPYGISQPSATDLDELTFPGIVYLIWYQAVNGWSCLGYLIQDQLTISEVPVVISTNL